MESGCLLKRRQGDRKISSAEGYPENSSTEELEFLAQAYSAQLLTRSGADNPVLDHLLAFFP